MHEWSVNYSLRMLRMLNSDILYNLQKKKLKVIIMPRYADRDKQRNIGTKESVIQIYMNLK